MALAARFLDEASLELGRSVGGFEDDATRALLAYRWPGNVRELRNVVRRAVLVSEGGISAADLALPNPVPGRGSARGAGDAPASASASATPLSSPPTLVSTPEPLALAPEHRNPHDSVSGRLRRFGSGTTVAPLVAMEVRS